MSSETQAVAASDSSFAFMDYLKYGGFVVILLLVGFVLYNFLFKQEE